MIIGFILAAFGFVISLLLAGIWLIVHIVGYFALQSKWKKERHYYQMYVVQNPEEKVNEHKIESQKYKILDTTDETNRVVDSSEDYYEARALLARYRKQNPKKRYMCTKA